MTTTEIKNALVEEGMMSMFESMLFSSICVHEGDLKAMLVEEVA